MEIIAKYFSELTKEQRRQFAQLKTLYENWNTKINVISRKDIDSLYERHVLHSLSIAAVFEFPGGTQILDIGTGGGFPGIPLAIYFPDVKFHLVDSIAKKLKVVEAIANAIDLKNVTLENTRVEELMNRDKPTRKFDFIVSRAVAPLKDLWKWSLPLLKKSKFRVQSSEVLAPNSQFSTLNSGLICLKGGDLSKEIRESGTQPQIMEIFKIFSEDYFHQKYIVYLSLK